MEEEQQGVRDLQEERFKLSELVQTPGWIYLVKLAQAQLEGRKTQLLSPINSLNDLPLQEFLKGEVSGIHLFVQMPGLRIEILTKEIDDALKENASEDQPDFTGRS